MLLAWLEHVDEQGPKIYAIHFLKVLITFTYLKVDPSFV